MNNKSCWVSPRVPGRCRGGRRCDGATWRRGAATAAGLSPRTSAAAAAPRPPAGGAPLLRPGRRLVPVPAMERPAAAGVC